MAFLCRLLLACVVCIFMCCVSVSVADGTLEEKERTAEDRRKKAIEYVELSRSHQRTVKTKSNESLPLLGLLSKKIPQIKELVKTIDDKEQKKDVVEALEELAEKTNVALEEWENVVSVSAKVLKDDFTEHEGTRFATLKAAAEWWSSLLKGVEDQLSAVKAAGSATKEALETVKSNHAEVSPVESNSDETAELLPPNLFYRGKVSTHKKMTALLQSASGQSLQKKETELQLKSAEDIKKKVQKELPEITKTLTKLKDNADNMTREAELVKEKAEEAKRLLFEAANLLAEKKTAEQTAEEKVNDPTTVEPVSDIASKDEVPEQSSGVDGISVADKGFFMLFLSFLLCVHMLC